MIELHQRHGALTYRPLPLLLASLAVVMWPAGATSQEMPPALQLNEDVSVTYVTVQSGALPDGLRSLLPDGGKVRSRQLFQARTGMARFEAGDASYAIIQDRHRQRSWTIAAGGRRTAPPSVTLQEGDAVGQLPGDAGRHPDYVARRDGGTSEVAGIPCVNWRVRMRDDAQDEGMLLCYAANGLVLRVNRKEEGGATVQEAERVQYGPLDPKLFEPPSGSTGR